MSRTGWSTASTLLFGLGVLALHPAIASADEPPTTEVSVRVEPAEAPPFHSVRVFGVSCGASWGEDNLAGFELNSVEDPPEHDEGISLWAHDIRPDADGTLSASFTVPEIPPGRYFLFYLCGDQDEIRAFRAMPPPDGRFLVIRRLPYVTAPPQVEPTPGQLLTGSTPLIIVALIPIAALLLMRLSRRTPFTRPREPTHRENED